MSPPDDIPPGESDGEGDTCDAVAEAMRRARECAHRLATPANWHALEAHLRSMARPAPAAPAALADALQWAVDRWHAEVAQRPLINVHRRTLDDTWRQVIRYCGGDPEALIGPSHDDLLASDAGAETRARLAADARRDDRMAAAARAALAGLPQEPAREPSDEEVAALWHEVYMRASTEWSSQIVPPYEFARAVRAWKPEESGRA